MDEQQLKKQICDIGSRVWQRGYVAANDGNFSVRLDANRILATPTMISKGFMEPEDICVLDLEGNQLSGRKKKTSEALLHLQIYRERPDVNAVIHTHPPHATAFAVVQEPIPKCVLPEVEIFLGEIPITEYGTPGSQEFAETIQPYLPDFNVFLLANHGALALGEDLIQAYFRTEIVDQYCRILIFTRILGGERQISQQKMAELFQLKEKLGIPDRRMKPEGNPSCQIPSPVTSSNINEEDKLRHVIRQVVQDVLQNKKY